MYFILKINKTKSSSNYRAHKQWNTCFEGSSVISSIDLTSAFTMFAVCASFPELLVILSTSSEHGEWFIRFMLAKILAAANSVFGSGNLVWSILVRAWDKESKLRFRYFLRINLYVMTVIRLLSWYWNTQKLTFQDLKGGASLSSSIYKALRSHYFPW